jgi:hypothetical protein
MIANGISPDSSYSSSHSSSTSSAVDWMLGCFGIVLVGVPVEPIGWVDPIFTVACGRGLAPPGCRGVVTRPTGPGPPLPGAFASGMVLAPTGEGAEATGADAVGTGRVGPSGSGAPEPVATGFVAPSGSGAFASGIVFAPEGAGAEGAGGGVGAEGAGGGIGAPEKEGAGAGGLGAGAFGDVGTEPAPMGAVVGPPVGSGAVASIGSVAVDGGIGPVAGIPAMEAVVGPPEGIGAVEPFGATGPDSSDCARKLILTVSFFSGTVEVLEEGLGGS